MSKLHLLDKEVVRKDVREVMEALSEKVLVSEFAQFITSDLLVESLEDGRADFCAKASKVGRRVELWVYREDTDHESYGNGALIQRFVIRAMAETPNADNRKYAHKTVEFIFVEEQE